MGRIYRQAGRHIWMLKYYRDGRAIVESGRTDHKTEAKKLLRQREADLDRGVPLGPRVGRIRFTEAATDVLNDYRVNNRRSNRSRASSRCGGSRVERRGSPGRSSMTFDERRCGTWYAQGCRSA